MNNRINEHIILQSHLIDFNFFCSVRKLKAKNMPSPPHTKPSIQTYPKASGFVCEFGGEEKGGFGKKEGARGKNRGFWEGRVLRDSFFFIIQNPPNLEELKNCIGESF
jgi:hypothetical protein